VGNRDEIRYSRTHEWARIEGDLARIGLSDYAQEHLGDVVDLDLPGPGKRVREGEAMGSVDSVKAASDIYSPVTGEVVEVNSAVESSPEIVNQDAEGTGWLLLVRLELPARIENLMSKAEYGEYVRTL